MIKQDTNPYLQPVNSPIAQGSSPLPQIPWEFGVNQGIQSKNIRASVGIFKNFTGTISGNNLSEGTIDSSFFKHGTIATSSFSGTISQPVVTGGTFTNPRINTGTIATSLMTGTLNNGVLGSPAITGGTANLDAYQAGGVSGINGTVIYIKTVSPGTTFGTLTFTSGLLTNSQ